MGRQMLPGIDVDLVLDAGDRDRCRLGADPCQIGAARHQRLVAHPDQVRGELVGHFRARIRADQKVPPRDVYIVDQRDGNRIACLRGRLGAVIGQDILDTGFVAGCGDDDQIADPDRPGRQRSGIAAEVEVRTIDPLHRESKWLFGSFAVDIDGLEIVEQGWAAIPRRYVGQGCDVVPVSGRDRYRHHRGEAELGREGGIFSRDAVERRLLVFDQVDLVHRHDDVAQAEQRADQRMPPRLHQHALASIDQDDGKVRFRGAGCHVAGILFEARRGGDDEGAPRRGKETVGDVDGDALFALGLQAVHQKGEIDVVAGGAVAYRILGEGGELVLEDELGIVQQPPDQGGLAIVHRSAGEEAQQILARLFDDGGHQK